jgi:hypothetical protein
MNLQKSIRLIRKGGQYFKLSALIFYMIHEYENSDNIFLNVGDPFFQNLLANYLFVSIWVSG